VTTTTAPPTDLRASLEIARVILRLLITRSRVLALGGLGLLVAGLGATARAAEDQVDAATGLVAGLGFSVVAPVATLVVASAALGDLRDDKTLVYLWLRPIPRLAIAGGAVMASLAVALPSVIIPIVISAVLSGVGDLVVASLVASIIAVIGYTGLFVAMGMRLSRPFLWGLAYILIWEDFIAFAGDGTARLSIRSYAWSTLHRATGVDLRGADRSSVASWIVPVVVLVVGTALTTWWLRRREID
jgi:ABC-2 type transport system permease protein